VPPAHPAASSTGQPRAIMKIKYYKNKNYENKKLWVIQKIFYLQKIKTKSFFILLQNYFVTTIRCQK
jgi:hypothetical protein